MGKNTHFGWQGFLGRTPLTGSATSLINHGNEPNSPLALAIADAPDAGTRPPALWRVLAGCALAGLGVACATGPAPRISRTAEIVRHLEQRLELRDQQPALRLTKPGRRRPVYLTGRELEDGAVVVFEVRF